MLFNFYLRTGFRMQEVMYLERADLDFENRTARVKAKPEYGFVPKRWHECTIPLEERLAVTLEARCKRLKQSDLAFPTRNGKANAKHRLSDTGREACRHGRQ